MNKSAIEARFEGLMASMRCLSAAVVDSGIVDPDVLRRKFEHFAEGIRNRDELDDAYNNVIVNVMEFCLGVSNQPPSTTTPPKTLLTVIDGGKAE